MQIGWVRARFPDVTMVALTATLRGGKYIAAVCRFLGFPHGQFHLIRRSNARPDIQIILRTMKSGMGGRKFPELDWILAEKKKTLIFARTIHLGWRIFTYLCTRFPPGTSDANKRIRLYNSLNSAEFNAETREFMENNPSCVIVIGTDTMSVGVDLSCIQDVVVVGEPEDIDDLMQKFGRIRPNKDRIGGARGILYLGEGALESAKQIVEARTADDKGKLKKGDTMDISIAEWVLADCKIDDQNRQYENPEDETPCIGCQPCLARPPLQRVTPCNCSGANCMPEPLAAASTASNPIGAKTASSIPRRDRLTKPMRELGTKRLILYRHQLWENADELQYGMLAPPIFLPDVDIKSMLDCFVHIHSVQELMVLLQHNLYLINNYEALFSVISALRGEFNLIREQNKEKERVGRANRTAAKKAAEKLNISVDEGPGNSEGESSGTSDSDVSERVRPMPAGERSGLKLCINMGYVL